MAPRAARGMSVVQQRIADPISCVSVVQEPAQLGRICNADCAGVIWQRQPVQDFQRWIDGLSPENLPSGRLILRPHMVWDAVGNLCDNAGTPKGDERDRLVDDIAALADIFAATMQAPFLRVRLDKITTNACRKFHVDALTARMICTYRGAGTQYGMAHGGGDPRRVMSVPTGAPFVLRGTKWPVTPAAGLLHRSPPIEGSGETRLVLVLDPVLDEATEI